MTPILGDITVADFLARHWQKQPLLSRRTATGHLLPLDGDELAGLACEPEIESRIVVTRPGPSYELQRGPFTETHFAALGDRDWTLLVQDVDKHLPDFAAFLDLFDFIPAWRLDDLMVSWAADGGSVGPHVDQYDVFLVQAAGRRRWRIGAPQAAPALRDDHELAILSRFETVDEWVLEPGDVLYVPPGIPHWGIAEGACMTWSVGFRAPSHRELMQDLADNLIDGRYEDPDLSPGEADRGRLSPEAVTRVAARMRQALAQTDGRLPVWLGEVLTSPKAWLRCEPPEPPPSVEGLAAAIRSGHAIRRDPRARLLWLEDSDGRRWLCADGHAVEVSARLEPLLTALCTGRRFPPGSLTRYLGDDEAMALIGRLFTGGQLLTGDG